MARWITITKVPFDYRWGPSAVTAFTQLGEFHVKAEVADFAIERGYAIDGKPADSEAKSVKGGPKRKTTSRRKRAKPAEHAETPDHGPDDRVDGEGLAVHDSADDRGAVDPAAG